MKSSLPSLAQIADCRILVVGDVMLDRYWHGEVVRISPEAPVPVVHIQREENRLGDAEKLKASLGNIVVKVDAKVGEEGQLFGSVTSVMIAEAIKAATDLDVDKRRIELGHPIKTAGEHEVSISLYRDIKTTVKLFVGADIPVVEEAAEIVEETEEAAESAEAATEE